jgi:hypothetical protein
VWCGEGEWALIFAEPLRICLVLEKYKSIVPIKLEETVNLQVMCCFVNYPDLFVYGYDAINFKNSIYAFNLNTFEGQEAKSTKEYAPKSRKGGWSFFSDFRLYVTGGVSTKG